MKKIYPISFYTTKALEDFKGALKLVRAKKEDFPAAYEKECDRYRKEIGTKNLIGITVSEKEGEIGIVEFPIEVERNTYHVLKKDKDAMIYIEIEEDAL